MTKQKAPKVRRLKTMKQIKKEFARGDVKVFINDKQVVGKPEKPTK